MNKRTVQDLAEVAAFQVSDQRLFSATHEEIISGLTTDIYFIRTRELLRHLGLDRTRVTAEIFAGKPGVLAGIEEAKVLLKGLPIEVWALPEGTEFKEKQVIMRITGAYDDFGIHETSLLGILASSSGWATAARRCQEAAGNHKMICFGARHVHPAVAPVMERAAIIGGADGASCILGAKLAGQTPSGTVPHAVMLIVGDTLEVAQTYQRIMPPEAPVIVLVDTFKDEAEEALRVADQMGEKLQGIRLDTPSERGGVTPGLVREIKARLRQAGHAHVKIFVSGGVTPERITLLIEAGADAFGVGSYISGAPAVDMTMDIKEIDGHPIAKRGRIPGITESAGLEKIL
ncbi:nicotinate phosphoribosyltransferase [Desulfotomaculum arcticum]|uniref:Nicotinate phosphoribosyltransferase n=1 Tax=Desulfotruncus arcticus DSM 17038 TaxID=1121424 RepID=A0A1I2RI64_9FIRM|nr:nicotinate phosphoribosyltransferase [Desulfotruncus arcticus]SFG37466.1 nicotinate phosphoribosyltransferase [Desulfotomaculum arcticum] [Desulfotruncus arcticus DSM 17038]